MDTTFLNDLNSCCFLFYCHWFIILTSEPKSIVRTPPYVGPEVMLKKQYDASYDPSDFCFKRSPANLNYVCLDIEALLDFWIFHSPFVAMNGAWSWRVTISFAAQLIICLWMEITYAWMWDNHFRDVGWCLPFRGYRRYKKMKWKFRYVASHSASNSQVKFQPLN